MFGILRRLARRGGKRYLAFEESEGLFFATRVVVRKNKISEISKKQRVSEMRKPLFPPDLCIVGLDSDSAFTLEDKISVERGSSGNISKEEEEHVIFQGLWKFLNENRRSAARQFDIPDSKVVLANIGIDRMRMDGTLVPRMVGTAGRVVELVFRGTFVPETSVALLEEMHKTFSTSVFVVESDAALALLAHEKGRNTVAVCKRNESRIFSSKKDAFLEIKGLKWGTERIFEIIQKEFEVSRSFAEELLNLYARDDLSEKMRALLRTPVRKEFLNFSEKILRMGEGKKARRDDAFVFFASPSPLFSDLFEEETGIQGGNIGEVLKNRTWESTTKPSTATVLGAYAASHTEHPSLQKSLERRARWISSWRKV